MDLEDDDVFFVKPASDKLAIILVCWRPLFLEYVGCLVADSRGE